MAPKRSCILVLGPTAGGKSSLAFRLAQGMDGVVISADSMQIYRHMNAGTAKPSATMRRQVTHAMIDIVEPTERFTVAQWLEQARRTIDAAQATHRVPIVVGGTNLYVKALLEGLFEGPPADPALRDELGQIESAELHLRLAAVDTESAERIHPHDRRRMIRALEVHAATGRPISHWQQQWKEGVSDDHGYFGDIQFHLIGLSWSRDAINHRINERVGAMFHPQRYGPQTLEELGITESLPCEARRLWESGSLGDQSSQALGYKQVISHIQGQASLAEAFEQTKIQTRRFAKQQRTWLRRFRGVHWLDADGIDPDRVFAQANEFLSACQ